MKKYAPYIFLLVGATAIFVIKTNQRGHSPLEDQVNVNVPAIFKGKDTGNQSIDSLEEWDNFNRKAHHIIYSKHARCRMECRHITSAEVQEVLTSGEVNEHKVKEDDKGNTYPLEGKVDGHRLRIVFAPVNDDAVEVVTCIDLDNDWPCDCK